MSNGGKPKRKKLSDRALIILRHIADRSVDGRLWLSGHSRGCDDHDEPSHTYLNIAGSGDGAILRSLVAAELLCRDPPKQDCSNQYQWLRVTPKGLELLEAQADRVGQIRAELYRVHRASDFASCKRNDYDEEELRELFPEMYDAR